MKIIYTVVAIIGDYVLCRSDSGNETEIARALLPQSIDDGDKIIYEYGMYREFSAQEENN